MIENWYSSKKIRDILQISPQCLYHMRTTGRILAKRISDRKYLYKLPETFDIVENTPNLPRIAIYARVSTPKQKKDLENQLSCLRQYVVSNGNVVDEKLIFFDIASGMNENRTGLNSLISLVVEGRVDKVIISNKDRLTRFGYGYFKTLFDKFNCEIIEVNLTEDKTFEQELTDDLIATIHHFSMKFHGKRRNKLQSVNKELKSSDFCN